MHWPRVRRAWHPSLTKFTDVDIKAATGSATGKDISLTLDASKKAELGDEGFKLNIGSKGLEVIGATDIGVFYGTRSVSQMLRQGQLTLPAGHGRHEAEVQGARRYAVRLPDQHLH